MNGDTTALQTIDGTVLATEPVRPTMIRPLATPDEAYDAWQAFQQLKARIVTKEDTQHVGGQDRITKSGWRKIGAAFGISTEALREERRAHADGNGFVWECVVRAIAPNGRYADGLGSFDTRERRMAHLEHDARATAFTRACNRAISDLVGGGEVSAEEIKAEAAPTLTREQASELITQFERSCDDKGVGFDYRSLAVQLLQSGDDLRRAFKYFRNKLEPSEPVEDGMPLEPPDDE